jgi:deoxyadenosine/deoxycytidine kinase
VAVIGNICAGKSTFVNRFSASHQEWYGLPEVLSESQRSSLRGPDPFYLYASFFADFYIERHRLAQQIPGPLIQESCLESSSLFPRVYYENNCFSRDKYCILELKYAKYLKVLPRPDFYIYLYAPLDVLLARAEIRKEPARTVSLMLMPRMQDRLESWVETYVEPGRLFRIDSLDINTDQMNKLFGDLQARLKVPENGSL